MLHRRFHETIEAITFIVEHLETARPNPATPLAKLFATDLASVVAEAAALHAKLDAYRIRPA